MADLADDAAVQQEHHLDRHLQAVLAARAAMPAGEPGPCDRCGEDMPRLVDGLCGYCRDGRRP